MKNNRPRWCSETPAPTCLLFHVFRKCFPRYSNLLYIEWKRRDATAVRFSLQYYIIYKVSLSRIIITRRRQDVLVRSKVRKFYNILKVKSKTFDFQKITEDSIMHKIIATWYFDIFSTSISKVIRYFIFWSQTVVEKKKMPFWNEHRFSLLNSFSSQSWFFYSFDFIFFLNSKVYGTPVSFMQCKYIGRTVHENKEFPSTLTARS